VEDSALVTNATIIWRRLDVPGHESARLLSRDVKQFLAGTSVFIHDGEPCRLDYSIVCSPAWQTESVSVRGWVGHREIEVDINVDSLCRWKLNGHDVPAVAGCLDVDLNFSPSTNLLPIRRLNLGVGQSAAVTAAWLRFPGFQLAPLPQTYRRDAEQTYRYESAGGSFVRDLTVNDAGFVTHYPGFFTVEEAS
jgi:hypothetical protein